MPAHLCKWAAYGRGSILVLSCTYAHACKGREGMVNVFLPVGGEEMELSITFSFVTSSGSR